MRKGEDLVVCNCV